jgi:hypothetical protein
MSSCLGSARPRRWPVATSNTDTCNTSPERDDAAAVRREPHGAEEAIARMVAGDRRAPRSGRAIVEQEIAVGSDGEPAVVGRETQARRPIESSAPPALRSP